jgi:hypothetical protein
MFIKGTEKKGGQEVVQNLLYYIGFVPIGLYLYTVQLNKHIINPL